MSILEQDLPIQSEVPIIANTENDVEEAELYHLQHMSEEERTQYQQFLEDGINNNDAFYRIKAAREIAIAIVEPEPEPIEMTIKRKLTAVHYLRLAKETMMGELAQRKIAFDLENKDLLDNIAKQGELLSTAETDLRLLAIDQFDGKNKKPFPGCGIRVSIKETPIYDPAIALTWAKVKNICLQLDVKAFEQICLTDSRPEFVKIVENESTSATIDTNLTKALSTLGIETGAE